MFTYLISCITTSKCVSVFYFLFLFFSCSGSEYLRIIEILDYDIFIRISNICLIITSFHTQSLLLHFSCSSIFSHKLNVLKYQYFL